MKELSIFIDESGDIGEYQSYSPYYIISMVLHNQEDDISEHISTLNRELKYLGVENIAIHTEPLVRREEAYVNMWPDERRAILTKLYFFAIKSPILFKTFIFEKKQFSNVLQLEARMAKELAQFIRENIAFFQEYSNIILYYDNGQRIINRIFNTVFATELSKYEVRQVMPVEYKLFQVADLLCTLTLIEKKLEHGQLTRSEEYVFHSKRDFYKDFYNRLSSKTFENK